MHYIITFSAVIIGFLIALFLKPQKKTNIKLLLAFSGAFLLSLTVLHLLPELFSEGHNHLHNGEAKHASLPVGVFIMIGILFQILLEFFSKGAEHGHVHGHEKMNAMPWTLFLSLCLHAFLEGFPIEKHHDLAYGIAIHHLPIAIILTTFFINAQLNKWIVGVFMIFFSIMTPLGTLFSSLLPAVQQFQNQITAIVIGILFHISSTIIFESSEGHKFNIAKVSIIIMGILLAIFL